MSARESLLQLFLFLVGSALVRRHHAGCGVTGFEVVTTTASSTLRRHQTTSWSPSSSSPSAAASAAAVVQQLCRVPDSSSSSSSRRPSVTDGQRGRCNALSGSSIGWPLFMGRAAAVRASTKAKTDMKKAKTNAIYGKKLVMAIKEGGGSTDPAANRQLADVMKNAKANSVPVENINRILKKASEGVVGDFKELTYEAYGIGGASMIINVLTDNTNRANGDVRSTVTRRNGKMAESGSVLFLYDHKGKVTVPTTTSPLDEEKLLEAAISLGIDDYEVVVDADADEEGKMTTTIYTDVKEAALMLEAVQTLGFDEGLQLSLVHVSKAPVECSDEDFEKNMSIIDALEELDDVDSVEHNMAN